MSEGLSIEKKIEKVLSELMPYVSGHGGGITFVDFDSATGLVRVRLEGACQNCSLSQLTLKFGLEESLRKEIPEVSEVIAI